MPSQDVEILASHTTHTGKTPASHFHADFSDCVPSFYMHLAPKVLQIEARPNISWDLFKKSNTTGLAGNFP